MTSLIITFILGLFFIAGALVVKVVKDKERLEDFSVAAALGALVFISVFDIIPEIFEIWSGSKLIFAAIFVALGVGILMGLDHFVPDHDSDELEENMVHIGVMTVMALSLHNIVEGMSVYSISSASLSGGISLAVGVGLHNIPMGMLIYSTLDKEKLLKKRIVLSCAAFSTFVGGLLMYLLGEFMNETIECALICVALGMVIYIVFFELLPNVIHAKKWFRSGIGFAVGALIVFLSMMLG